MRLPVPVPEDFRSPPAQPRRGGADRSLARHLFRHLLPDRPDQPLRAESRPADPVPDQPVVGLPRHPGPARPARGSPRSRCCSSSCGRSIRGCSSARRAISANSSSTLLERASIAVLVAAAIFELTVRTAEHHPVVPLGLLVPRPPTTRSPGSPSGRCCCTSPSSWPSSATSLGADIDAVIHDRTTATEPGALTRRGLVRTTWLAAGMVVLANAGASVPFLRRVSVFAVNSGDGPMGIPINKTAAAADVTAAATSADYRARDRVRRRTTRLSLADLAADGAAHRGPADRLRRGVERLRHLDRRPAPRPARPRRRPGAERRTHVARCSRAARSGTRPCRATSPTTTAPCWRCGSTASRWRSTTDIPAG